MIIIDNFIEYYQDHVRVREATKKGYAEAMIGDSINLEQPNSKTRRGRVGHQIANTLTTSCNQGVVEVNELIQVGQLEGKHEQSNRVYSEDGVCPTLMAGQRISCTGGYVSPKIMVNTNKIIRDIIPQKVRVRKYDVDIENLKLALRENKLKYKLTNRQMAERLNQPLTLVEHWFRSDNCFSIPNEDVWFDLKSLLNIETDEFDKSITTFEIRDGVYDKSNRVYDSNGIAPTLTCVSAENERYKVYEDMSNPKLVGGIEEINFGKQFRQGNRVYDSEEIAICSMSQPVGDIGGFSYLYTVKNKLNNKRGMKMWNNNLEKLNFKMEEIRVFDIFAGIGALHQSLKELGVPVRVTNLSEVDIDATISYAAGHIENFKDLEFECPSIEDMRQWLIDRNIGYSFEKNKSSVPRMKVEKLKLAYKANVLLNNLGDISKINYDKIEDFDLMNMSFPCTDLSNAGKQRGMRNEDGTPTRSGLYVYSIKAVRAKKPKYVMIENVKALIQKKFIDDFYSVINELEECGYNCYYPTKQDKKGNISPTCLNAKDFGIPQNRERIFVIAIRKDVDNHTFDFPIGKDYGIRLKDVLEDHVDEKYYLSQEIQDRFKLNGKQDVNHNELNILGSSAPECRTIGQRDITYGVNGIMSTLTATDYKQPKQILNVQNGAIRGRYNSEGKIEQQLELRDDGITNTLTTVEKDNVLLENAQEIRIRKLTPLECWRLMGFRDEAFYNAKELGISDSQLYKQAGNSIVVNCLYYIFKNLFKGYIIK